MTQRLETLDMLRGFALLGMFVVHFHERSTELGGVDEVIRTLIWRLIESKSHGAFALLFGAGVAIQHRRAEERGESFGKLYLRRLAVLALFGFAAHAFFGYNVLLGYAVWGLPLLLLRKWSTRALVVTAVLSAASVTLYHLAGTRYLLLAGGSDSVEAYAQAQRAMAADVRGVLEAAEAQGSYTILVATRLEQMAWFYSQPFFFMPGATAALFITGLLLIRHRVFEEAGARPRILAAMAACGLVSWIAANWLLPLWSVPSFGLLRDQWLTFTYVAGVLALLAWRPGYVLHLRPIANAGRMALTNYLVQIAALDYAFSGYGLNLREVRPVVGLAAALTCFAAEAAFSTAWLTYFRLGPAEWLWRSLTYGQAQRLRRKMAAVPEAV